MGLIVDRDRSLSAAPKVYWNLHLHLDFKWIRSLGLWYGDVVDRAPPLTIWVCMYPVLIVAVDPPATLPLATVMVHVGFPSPAENPAEDGLELLGASFVTRRAP